MPIYWNKVIESEPTLEILRQSFPEVERWDEPTVADHVPKAWKKAVTFSVGLRSSGLHERSQFATIFQLGAMLFYRSADKEVGPFDATFPSSAFGCHPWWADSDARRILHVVDYGLEADVDALAAIRDVVPPLSCFSLNGELYAMQLDGRLKAFRTKRQL